MAAGESPNPLEGGTAMEMMAGQEPQVQAEAQKKAPLWEDVVDIFVSPAALFRRNAKSSWVVPWLVLSVILAVVYLVFMGPFGEMTVAQTREVMARAGRELPAAALQPPGLVRHLFTALLFQPIGLLIGILLGGFLLWIAALVAQGGPRFPQAMMIIAWASFPSILQKVVQGVLVLLKTSSGAELSPTRDVSTGLLRFLDPSTIPLPLVSALAMVDLFALWSLILWIVALKAICHYSTGKATAVAVATWLLLLLPLMGFGLLGQLAMGG